MYVYHYCSMSAGNSRSSSSARSGLTTSPAGHTRSKTKARGLNDDNEQHHSSRAAMHSQGSSSTNSKTNSFKDNNIMIRLGSTFGTEAEYYSLKDVVDALGLNEGNLRDEISKEYGRTPKVINDHIAGKCVAEMCSQAGVNCTIAINQEVPCMSLLTSFAASTHIQPDVVVHIIGGTPLVVGFLGEVLSSPMKETEVKAMLLGINFLRLVRCTDPSCVKVAVFVFPKLEMRRYIGMVEVGFDGLGFNINLTIYPTVQEGMKAVITTLNNTDHHHTIRRVDVQQKAKYLIHLNQDELRRVGSILDTIVDKQYASRSNIILRCNNGQVVKFIVNPGEVLRMEALKPEFRACKVTIVPTLVNTTNTPTSCLASYITYDRIVHDPLTVEEAKLCLQGLVKAVGLAMCEMHENGFAHNDIRLPNICFDEDFKVKFIDVDRATTLKQRYTYEAKMGCMYDNIKGTSSDVAMVQLGWMVAAVVHPVAADHYHNRVWETEPRAVTENEFICDLIVNHRYCCDKVSLLPDRGQSLRDVLSLRSRY